MNKKRPLDLSQKLSSRSVTNASLYEKKRKQKRLSGPPISDNQGPALMKNKQDASTKVPSRPKNGRKTQKPSTRSPLSCSNSIEKEFKSIEMISFHFPRFQLELHLGVETRFAVHEKTEPKEDANGDILKKKIKKSCVSELCKAEDL
jgi:hypothetical protein